MILQPWPIKICLMFIGSLPVNMKMYELSEKFLKGATNSIILEFTASLTWW